MNETEFKDVFDKRLIFLVIISAILYQFGYWSTFRLNVLGYMSINNMISSFVYPFLGAFLSYVVYLITDWFQKALVNEQILTRPKLSKRQIIVYIVFLGLYIWLCFILGIFAWIWVPFLAWFMYSNELMVFLIKNKTLPEDLKYARFVQIALLLFLMSFCLGKRDSKLIHKNVSFDYVKKTDSLGNEISIYKILGNAGEYIFFETLDNTEKIISKSDKFEPITINHYFNNSTTLTETDSLILNKIKLIPKSPWYRRFKR
jgi:hypothetical protein